MLFHSCNFHYCLFFLTFLLLWVDSLLSYHRPYKWFYTVVRKLITYKTRFHQHYLLYEIFCIFASLSGFLMEKKAHFLGGWINLKNSIIVIYFFMYWSLSGICFLCILYHSPKHIYFIS
ncbi:hypothetical protein X975_26476, partial [Stegodyphus mimosarum]